MTNFIPIFPLGIVVYPGEQLNLHIFEPRYIQLINECFADKKPFGIPVIINDELNELGTLVMVKEISKVYVDGKMDIKTEGLKVFRILEIIKELPEKLYGGAIVYYPENNRKGNDIIMQSIIEGIKSLHKLLKVDNPGHFKGKKKLTELESYNVAHHAGLTVAEEYKLLELMQELQRQEFLRQHLFKVLQVMNEMEILKERIKLNGHFKNLKGPDVL